MRKLKLLFMAAIAFIAIGGQTARAAAVDYLTGWTEVTSLPTDNSELSKYYFVFVATEADLMLAQEYGTGKLGDSQEDLLTVVYRTPGNPLTAKKFVWMLSYDATYLFGIRNLNNSTCYMQSRKNNPWRVQFNWETAQSEWTQWEFAYADSKWTIQNKMSSGNGGSDDYYLGYWVDSSTANAYKDNMVAAGNKGAGDYQGKFKIYRISREDFKAPTDVTSSYITNPSFEYSAEGTAATAGKITTGCYGWSIPTLSSNSNRSIGSSTECDGQAAGIPTPSDGSFYYFNRNGWNGSGKTYTLSTTATLPVGAYTLLMDYKGVDSYNNGNTGKNSTIVLKATKGSDLNSITSPYFTSYSVEKTNTTRDSYFVNNGWKTMSLPFVIDSEGEVTLSIVQNMKGGVRTDIVLDNFHLLYSNINVESLAALIAQATSINSETGDLTSAIATAQTVYDGINNTAAYQSTIDDAISTLKSAITTSVAGISMNHRDDLSYLIANVGFEGLTAETSDYGTGNGKDYSDGGWVLTTTGSFSYGAVLSYDSGNKINNAAIPATDNAGNTGNAFGLSAGWSGSQIYQTAPITLPAGKYIFKVNTYNAGTSTPLTSKFGFVPTSGDATLSTKTSYAKGSWETEEVTFTLGSATEGCFQFGGVATSGGSDKTAKVFYDNITLTYITDLGLAKEAWDEAKDAAEAARDNSDYDNVTGGERTNLETEIGKSEPNTVDGYNDATSDLETATATFIAAKSEYDRYAAEKANADRISTSIASGISAPTTAAGCDAVINSILVAEYNYVNDNFSADATDGYSLGLDTWTFTGTYNGGTADTRGTNSSEHWSGSARTYYEQGANGWGANSWVANYTKTVTLPAATYVLRVAARGSTNTTASMSVTIGGNTYSEALPSKGGATKGITTGGIANFDDGEFANTTGRGWQWRYLAFTLADETEVTFNFDASTSGNHEWFSICDLALKSDISNVSVTVTSAGFATYVPSYNLDFSETDIKAYKVKVSDKGVATLTQVDEVPANTPVLLHKAGGATENIPVIASADAVSGNDLVAGTGEAVPTTDGAGNTNMILNVVKGQIGFYFANNKTVATDRAYLHIASSLAPDAEGPGSRMVMVFADETTGVNDVRSKMSEVRGTYYNLNGQRVEKPAKGLYIVNGKKVIIK